MTKRPTINDVARYAGVSKSTVSLVLNNSPLIKKTTTALVLESMQALNYVYNRTAANLRGSKRLIGLVINDLRNPFFTEFAIHAQMIFARYGYSMIIANTDEDNKIQSQVVRDITEHDIAALIISPSYGDSLGICDYILASKTPTLQVIRSFNEPSPIPLHSMEFESGGELATEHLIAKGVRNIAYVGGIKGHPVSEERISGYLKVMTKNALNPIIFHGQPTRAFGVDIAHSIIKDKRKIEAAVCFNDLTGFGMLSGLSQEGISIGKDFLLVGFDDVEECRQVFPQLSSVKCDLKKFAEQVAITIINLLNNDVPPPDEFRQPVKLVARQSSRGA